MLQGHQTVFGISLLLAPLLMFISSFFWVNGEYGVTGGTIPILSTVFWIMAMVYLFGLLKTRIPGIAQWGLLIAIFGFFSGGLLVLMEYCLKSSVSLIKHTLMLLQNTRWAAIMIIVGGLIFPASRISGNEWLAHLDDLTLLIPVGYLAGQILFAQRR